MGLMEVYLLSVLVIFLHIVWQIARGIPYTVGDIILGMIFTFTPLVNIIVAVTIFIMDFIRITDMKRILSIVVFNKEK